jgi:hypothetical protein
LAVAGIVSVGAVIPLEIVASLGGLVLGAGFHQLVHSAAVAWSARA